MDDWNDRYTEVDPPDTHPALLDQDGREIEARRFRAPLAEAVRTGELQQAEGPDAVGEAHALMGLPRPFATPPGAALTF